MTNSVVRAVRSRIRSLLTWFLPARVGALVAEELRALQAGTSTDGGYLVAPEQFVVELIKAVDDQVSATMTTQFVADALMMALWRRGKRTP